jgi:AcrR family transcriptional regulator
MEAAENTKYRLAEGLKKVMEKYPVDKITVKQIVDESRVTRPTFYRYFKDKYDLINWYFDKVASRSFKQMGIRLNLREALIVKFKLMQEEGCFFPAAFRCQCQNSLIEYDYNSIYQFYREFIRNHTGKPVPEDVDFVLKFYCIGSIYMTSVWAKEGMVKEPEKMADDLIKSLPPGLREEFPVE